MHIVQRIETRVQFEIPVMEPVFSTNIEITTMDGNSTFENMIQRDERIATLRIDYAALKKDYDGHMKPQWIYLYGAPRKYQSGYARKMNQGLTEGSHLRGALLIECKVDKKKIKQKERVDKSPHLELRPGMIEYHLQVDLYEGAEINKISRFDSEQVFVMVSVNEVCDEVEVYFLPQKSRL